MGADELDIDSDWKKARAFLVAYSTVVLLAWYFSADISSFSMMGISIQIKANAHNIWLVIAAINLYFIIRYSQKLPKEHRSPDDTMLREYESQLIKYTFIHNKKKIEEHIISHQNEKASPAFPFKKVIEIAHSGEMLYRAQLEADKKNNPLLTNNQYRKHFNDKIYYKLPFSYETADGNRAASSGINLDFQPTQWIKLKSLFIGSARGALFTPWLSDYILPLLFGFIAYGVSLSSWLAVNKYI